MKNACLRRRFVFWRSGRGSPTSCGPRIRLQANPFDPRRAHVAHDLIGRFLEGEIEAALAAAAFGTTMGTFIKTEGQATMVVSPSTFKSG